MSSRHCTQQRLMSANLVTTFLWKIKLVHIFTRQNWPCEARFHLWGNSNNKEDSFILVTNLVTFPQWWAGRRRQHSSRPWRCRCTSSGHLHTACQSRTPAQKRKPQSICLHVAHLNPSLNTMKTLKQICSVKKTQGLLGSHCLNSELCAVCQSANVLYLHLCFDSDWKWVLVSGA